MKQACSSHSASCSVIVIVIFIFFMQEPSNGLRYPQGRERKTIKLFKVIKLSRGVAAVACTLCLLAHMLCGKIWIPFDMAAPATSPLDSITTRFEHFMRTVFTIHFSPLEKRPANGLR
jgi:hypothetical protein